MMKRSLFHKKMCVGRSIRGCHVCKQFSDLLSYHSKGCEEEECLVPNCTKFKKCLKRNDPELDLEPTDSIATMTNDAKYAYLILRRAASIARMLGYWDEKQIAYRQGEKWKGEPKQHIPGTGSVVLGARGSGVKDAGTMEKGNCPSVAHGSWIRDKRLRAEEPSGRRVCNQENCDRKSREKNLIDQRNGDKGGRRNGVGKRL